MICICANPQCGREFEKDDRKRQSRGRKKSRRSINCKTCSPVCSRMYNQYKYHIQGKQLPNKFESCKVKQICVVNS